MLSHGDIIRMAREAGFDDYGSKDLILERFAALVAAAEREECAKVCDQYAERRWDTAVAEKCAAAIRAGMQA
jgi:hypothetical protein